MKHFFNQTIGLLGMNRRNAEYIIPHNPRIRYPLVDDKFKTKQLLEQNHLPVAQTYLRISHPFEIHLLEKMSEYTEFVIKPCRGAEGRGIVVIVGRQGDLWRKSSGECLDEDELEYHVTNILAGLYSLGGSEDSAFIEGLIHAHSAFEKIAFQGVPDVRVIVYRGIPAMAMLRLPTKESDGKANLHQGALGTGVDMVNGTTLSAVHNNKIVHIHPDTREAIAGVTIPFWPTILGISSRVYDIFGLGYMGVDFVIDRDRGPVILELNARPGLSIQLANQEGLLHRLKKIDALYGDVEILTPEERCEMAKHFKPR